MSPEVIAEYILRNMSNGELWIDVKADREPYGSIGPFDTEAERQAALDELLDMTRSLGAIDIPTRPQ